MSLKLWKLLSIRIKVEDHNGKIHWYDETDCDEHGLGIEYDITDIIKHQGGTLDEEEVGKLSYNPDNILNWDIKCTKEPEEDAVFFGVFLYKAGTPHDYESKKGITYYYNNIERDELPSITKFLKKRFGGNEYEKGERIFLEGSKEIYSGNKG